MAPAKIVLRDPDGREYRVEGAGGAVTVDGVPVDARYAADGSIHVRAPRNATLWAVRSGEVCWVFVDGQVFTFELERPVRLRRRAAADHHSAAAAPMPATVLKVLVAPGEAVNRGDTLVILEAMKMELPVRAASAATVTTVHCREGELVQAGQDLVELEARE